MRTALLLAVWLAGGCCKFHRCPPDRDTACHYDAKVQEPEVDATLVDAAVDSNVDAAPDAPPRPDESTERCINPREVEHVDRASCDDTNGKNGDLILATVAAAPECGRKDKLAKLDGLADVDVFRTGECSLGTFPFSSSPLMPWVEVAQQADPADDISGVEVCIFPTCTDGSTNVYACYDTPTNVAPTDSTPPTTANNLARSQVGFRGCCRKGAGRITAQVSCPRQSRKLDTFIWVQRFIDPQMVPVFDDHVCVAYKLTFSMK